MRQLKTCMIDNKSLTNSCSGDVLSLLTTISQSRKGSTCRTAHDFHSIGSLSDGNSSLPDVERLSANNHSKKEFVDKTKSWDNNRPTSSNNFLRSAAFRHAPKESKRTLCSNPHTDKQSVTVFDGWEQYPNIHSS